MLKKLTLCFLTVTATVFAGDVARISPAKAAALVHDGHAVLVDVRETAEWKETGVAQPAVLLEKSDFDGARAAWTPFLRKIGKDRTIILYCRSGKRAGTVAEALAAQGFKVVNAGGFKDWADAGLPVRQVE
ncbi:MAG: sulfurtransferase [Opitutus sp.]|nr:sulfurtransferase [Opitutus sp.]